MLAAPDFGRVVHLGGDVVAEDIATRLCAQGRVAVHLPCYRLVGHHTMAPRVVHALESGGVQHVLVTSVQAAVCFDALLSARGLASAWDCLDVYAISSRVAKALPASPRSVYIAPTPDMQGLVKSLQSRLTHTPS